MKMKKVLAAALAGTMVFGTATSVIAAPKLLESKRAPYECWWGGPVDLDGDGEAEYTLTEEEYESKFVYLSDLEGDGTWTTVLKCLPTDLEGQVYVVSGDVYDDNDHWCSYGTHGDCWGDANCSGQNTAHAAELEIVAGDYITIQITREGQDYGIAIAVNGTDEYRFKSTGSKVEGDVVHSRLGIQFGAFDIYDFQEEDAATALANVQALDAAAEEPESEEVVDSEAEAQETEAAGDQQEESGSAEEETATPIKKTGDAAPIAAVVVALAGCAAIAFASKKRFVK